MKSEVKKKDGFLEFYLKSFKNASFIKERQDGKLRLIFLTEKGMEHTRKLREKEYREKQNQILENQTKFNKYLVILYFVIALSGLAIMIPSYENKYPILIIGVIFILYVPFDYFILPLIKKYKEYRKREEFKVKIESF